MLIVSAFGAAISIAHGNRDGSAVNDRDGVRHAAYLGGYCAAKSPFGMERLPLMVLKDPLRQYMSGILMTSDHASFPIGSAAAAMVDIV